jgi:hypothetical protein
MERIQLIQVQTEHEDPVDEPVLQGFEPVVHHGTFVER